MDVSQANLLKRTQSPKSMGYGLVIGILHIIEDAVGERNHADKLAYHQWQSKVSLECCQNAFLIH